MTNVVNLNEEYGLNTTTCVGEEVYILTLYTMEMEVFERIILFGGAEEAKEEARRYRAKYGNDYYYVATKGTSL